MSGRHRVQKAYGHAVRLLAFGSVYRASWTVDRYYAGSRQRFPTVVQRDMEEDGALRFARRHNVPIIWEDKARARQCHAAGYHVRALGGAGCSICGLPNRLWDHFPRRAAP